MGLKMMEAPIQSPRYETVVDYWNELKERVTFHRDVPGNDHDLKRVLNEVLGLFDDLGVLLDTVKECHRVAGRTVWDFTKVPEDR